MSNPLHEPSNAKAAGCPCMNSKMRERLREITAPKSDPACPTGYLFDAASKACVLERL